MSVSLADTTADIGSLSEDERQCAENCFTAAETCEWCANECIEMGDEGMARCIRLCRDVADIASLHARFMTRDSEFDAGLATVCADACEVCADECAQHDEDHCQLCAEVLRKCARSCREMAA